MKKTLSKKYGFLRIFQVLIGLFILYYTYNFVTSIGDMPAGDLRDYIIGWYLTFVFSSICIISMVNFLFRLDATKNNLEGLETSYYANGQIKEEGNYKDGKKDGLWKYWDENGKLRYEKNYKDGERDGLWKEWFKNGQLTAESNYKDGLPDGLWKKWYENGQLKYERNYKDGKRID